MNMSPERAKELQDMFGFIDGKTYCECGCLLTRDDCFWGTGRWWHNKTESCEKERRKE